MLLNVLCGKTKWDTHYYFKQSLYVSQRRFSTLTFCVFRMALCSWRQPLGVTLCLHCGAWNQSSSWSKWCLPKKPISYFLPATKKISDKQIFAVQNCDTNMTWLLCVILLPPCTVCGLPCPVLQQLYVVKRASCRKEMTCCLIMYANSLRAAVFSSWNTSTLHHSSVQFNQGNTGTLPMDLDFFCVFKQL